MYSALFLSPWMLMYALSTMIMNHNEYFVEKYGRGPGTFESEREVAYPGSFPADAENEDVAREILSYLDLEGANRVQKRPDGTFVINRADLLHPRRITYSPSEQRITVEKLRFRADRLLVRFHTRRGYSTGYALDTVWAVSVDLVIAAMIFWALSGLWMWWEMKLTRKLGALAILAGLGLWLFYLFTI